MALLLPDLSATAIAIGGAGLGYAFKPLRAYAWGASALALAYALYRLRSPLASAGDVAKSALADLGSSPVLRSGGGAYVTDWVTGVPGDISRWLFDPSAGLPPPLPVLPEVEKQRELVRSVEESIAKDIAKTGQTSETKLRVLERYKAELARLQKAW